MYKKIIIISVIIIGTGIIGNEFTKPAREKRKEKMQQEAVCEECVKCIDILMNRISVVQERLSRFTGTFYRVLRSCAADDTPSIALLEVSDLKSLLTSLKSLEKQLQSIEDIVCKDQSFQLLLQSDLTN
jgi:hypothetical protein